MDWYKNNIEEEIVDFVFELRNKGINTTCSCGHEMWIEFDSNDREVDMSTIRGLMIEKNIKYWTCTIEDLCIDGRIYYGRGFLNLNKDKIIGNKLTTN